MSDDTTTSNGTDADDGHVLRTAGAAARRAPGPPNAAMPVERSRDLRTSLRHLSGIVRPERHRFVIVVACAVVSVMFVVLGPRLLGGATDLIISGVRSGAIDTDALHRRLFVIAGVYVGAWVFGYLGAYILTGALQRSMQRLRSDVEDKINRLPLQALEGHSRGDLLSRVTNDIDNLAQSLQQSSSQLVVASLTVVGTLVMMLLVSPLLTLVVIATVPVALVLMRAIAGRARPRFIEQWRSTGELNALAEDSVTGHAIVTSFGRQREVVARFNAENDRLYESSRSAQFISSLIQPMMVLAGNLQFVAIAVVGGLRIASGAITIGDMQAMLQYSRQFAQPMQQLAAMSATFQSGLASLDRVIELLDAPEVVADAEPTGDRTPTVGRVAFESVSFSYDPNRPLIADLDLVAEPGQTVAIVGPTGAGKTTLVNLLLRFYELDGGRITIDGRDITSMPRAELRSKFGMVLQDTWLFGDTIMENLRYGNPDATDAEVIDAAKLTFVDRFVRALPDGYQTLIDDDGSNISAGERQLMTIARAFLAEPAILILDEATSAVDTRTEVMIQEAMNRLRVDRTSFVIAHRLSTIRGADTIVVMDGGRIVEHGDHDQLIAAAGAYADLYTAQFEGQAT